MSTQAATDAVRTAVFLLLDGAVALPHPYAAGNPPRDVPVLEEVGNAEAPYIEIGAATTRPDDAHDKRGSLVTLSVHAWSSYRGFAEVEAVQRRVAELLDKRADVVVPGWTDVFFRVTDQRSMRDEDPLYRHGVTDVQVRLTQEED